MSKIGRNDLCPCGSKKKYKNCCKDNVENLDSCGVISIFYPGRLMLEPKSAYMLSDGNRDYFLYLDRHIKAVEILDLNNEIIEHSSNNITEYKLTHPIKEISKSNRSIKHGDGFHKIIEDDRHLHRSFTDRYYSELIVRFDIRVNEDAKELYNRHIQIVKKFIECYIIVSKDVRIRFYDEIQDDNYVTKFASFKYTYNDKLLPRDKRLTIKTDKKLEIKTMKYESVGGISPLIDREAECKISHNVANLLDSNYEMKLHDRLLLKSIQAFQLHQDYNLSVVNAFVSIEIHLGDYISSYKINNGVSNKKIKKYDNEIPIGYLIEVELPMILDEIDEEMRSVLGDINKLRGIRNKIVHQGYSATREEAISGVNSVMKYLEKLSGDGVDKIITRSFIV